VDIGLYNKGVCFGKPVLHLLLGTHILCEIGHKPRTPRKGGHFMGRLLITRSR